MFTGIIKNTGEVKSNNRGRLIVATHSNRYCLGASVCVNGVCLTVAQKSSSEKSGRLHFDLSPETLRLTNLGRLKPGDAVNIESSLRASDLIGGHWVNGHVDATVRILEIKHLHDGSRRMRAALPPALRPLVALKGSVAVDGVSLTVTRVEESFFETVLVPHTLKTTTLGQKKLGDIVNLEADMLARYLAQLLSVRHIHRIPKDVK